MPVRRFDGVDDEIRCAIGGCNVTGAFTLAALHRVTTAQVQPLFGTHTSASAVGAVLGVNASSFPSLSIGGTTLNGTEVGGAPTTGEWLLTVVSKASGTVAPRWHQYRFAEGVWRHANDGSTIGNPASQASGTVRFGEKADLDDFKGDLAICAMWSVALSDANIESLSSVTALKTGWASFSAIGEWPFDQSAVETALQDIIGAADQTTREGTEARAEEPPIPYSVKSAALGQATETDTAQALARRKSKALAQLSEADAAQSLGRAKSRGLGQAVSTGQALPMVPAKSRALGRAVEADAAGPVGRGKSVPFGLATEIDEAQGATPDLDAGVAEEVGQATEADAATPLGPQKSRPIGQVANAETALPMAPHKSRPIDLAIEASSAEPLGSAKSRAIDQPGESSAAEPVGAAKQLVVGQTLEVDETRVIAPHVEGQIRGDLDQAQELTISLPIGRHKGRPINTGQEANIAMPMMALKSRPLGAAVEGGQAEGLLAVKARSLGRAVEAGEALPISFIYLLDLAQRVGGHRVHGRDGRSVGAVEGHVVQPREGDLQ